MDSWHPLPASPTEKNSAYHFSGVVDTSCTSVVSLLATSSTPYEPCGTEWCDKFMYLTTFVSDIIIHPGSGARPPSWAAPACPTTCLRRCTGLP
ncbi:hypothetical protein PR202_ga12685 [Eleusine coracana subsp. coracana]|uniref:Uncharacterized protein n=1 Tax=Eleusine coracana subsp. coracana TaxID=191504 RepID=A0AAV5CC92_ELECO|nr:hypothetical protein PR202_ga12685 [Eleusine coracana subsp. coracana]